MLRSRSIRTPFIAALLVVVAVLVPMRGQALEVAADSGGGEVTFGVQPATTDGPDERANFTWGATPGATITDNVAVLNYSSRPLRLSVYATDAIVTDDGGFGLMKTGAKPRDAGSWISLPKDSRKIVVPPRGDEAPGSVVLPVTVAVPAKATPGDHSAGILAVLTTTADSADGTDVTLEQRVGTRVFIRVSGTLRPQLRVKNLTAHYDGTLNPVGRGSATVSYTLRNTGNVNLGADQLIEVSGLFGSQQVALDRQELLLPGSSVKVTEELTGVLPTVWKTARVDVTPLAVDGTADPPPPPFSESVRFWAVPWALICLVLLVALVSGAVWWQRRRRRATAPATTPDAERVAEEALS